ncbi:MAG: FkbM family methyltransferase [Candidatus Delongbacteria bacterium]|nr:FkbM family methyltransferase [Candidatus Delongbacteria bacterium]
MDLYQGKRNGFYVEAGALDGIAGSCTYLLETTLGWSGILVEPGIPYKALSINRSNNICLNLCLSGKNGPVIFADSENPGLSGIIDALEALDLRHQQMYRTPRVQWKEKGFKKKTIQSITLFDLLATYQAPRIVDYLALDVEGSEYDVLKVFPFNLYQIMAISIEGDQCHNLLLSNGFRAAKNPFNQDAPWERYYLHPNFHNYSDDNASIQ